MKRVNKIEYLSIWDCKYILDIMISKKLEFCYLTFDKFNKVKGMYEFKPKYATSYYYNQSSFLVHIHNLEIVTI